MRRIAAILAKHPEPNRGRMMRWVFDTLTPPLAPGAPASPAS